MFSRNLFPHSLNAPVNEQPPKDSLIKAEMSTHLSDIYFRSRARLDLSKQCTNRDHGQISLRKQVQTHSQFFFHYFWKRTKHNTLEHLNFQFFGEINGLREEEVDFFMNQSLLLFSSVNLMREFLSPQYSELKVIINSVYSYCK